MSLRNLLERKLVTCGTMATIKQVAELMETENVGAVVVVKDGLPQGIITDRDIVTRCVAKGHDCVHTIVLGLMSDRLITVPLDSSIQDVIHVMRKNKIRRLPVVDEEGRAVGLLTFNDLYQLLARELGDISQSFSRSSRPKLMEAS